MPAKWGPGTQVLGCDGGARRGRTTVDTRDRVQDETVTQ